MRLSGTLGRKNQNHMTLLDPRTVIMMASLLGGMMGLVLFLLNRTAPRTVPGLREWSLATAMTFVTAMLFGLRDTIPAWISVTLANAMLVGSFLMYLWGTSKYFGLIMRWRLWLSLGAVSVSVVAWFIHVEPNFRARLIAMVGLLALIKGWHAVVLYLNAGKRPGGATFGEKFTAFWLAALALVFSLRWVHAVLLPQEGVNLLAPNLVQSFYTSSYTIGLLMLTVGLALMSFEYLRFEFEHQATHDMLTGVANRRAIFEVLESEFARSVRYQHTFSVLMLDLDKFKQVNDQYGHQVGDQVLQRFTQSVAASIRPHDILGRTGGEEFLVVLPETGAHSAAVIAQRILEMVSRADAAHLPASTVSIGLTEWRPNDHSADAMLERADKALYTAKDNGRNQVQVL